MQKRHSSPLKRRDFALNVLLDLDVTLQQMASYVFLLYEIYVTTINNIKVIYKDSAMFMVISLDI